jgi:hypothetical protein
LSAAIQKKLLTKSVRKMKKLNKMMIVAGMMIAAVMLMFTACTKEGPQGPAGPAGADGTNGKDVNETCKLCHAKAVVDEIAVQFEMSKHNWGAAAFEEAGNASCGPCHEQKALIYVVENNTPSTFTFNTTTGKWVNDYTSNPANAIGEISCYTCHSQLHTTYGAADLALTTTAPVSMTMWGGAKTIDLPADGGSSNLCAKCHQPRPMTCAYDPATRLLNYDSIKNFPTLLQYDSTAGAKNKGVRPSYRLHVHYGVVSAVVAGQGGIEFSGSRTYSNSKHTTDASCSDCHMTTPMYGVAGGHSFNMRNAIESALSSSTTWNFAGCNTTGCHIDSPITKDAAAWKDTRAEVKTLLDALAAKINACGGGHDILHKDATSANLWAGVTTNNYDGYLDIYSAGTNDGAYWRDPANTSATNMAKPKFPKLLNVQVGAIINFQFCLREYSLGIHNTKYVKALLTNTVEALTAAGL